jgi:DNA replication protein DnaC
MAETLALYTTDEVCPKCKGEKGFHEIIDGCEYWVICDCVKREQEQKKLLELFNSAKIPKRYMSKNLDSFDKFRQPKAFKLAQNYLHGWYSMKREGKGLIFVGDVGTGKSHLAFALLLELLRRGITGMAATVPDLMDDLRPKRGETTEKQIAQIETLKNIDLLLLDDLGAQRNTEWVTERLFIILNARYNNMLPTIITSNERLEDLEATPGWRRIIDRIVEMCAVVVMDGESYRLDKAKSASKS